MNSCHYGDVKFDDSVIVASAGFLLYKVHLLSLGLHKYFGGRSLNNFLIFNFSLNFYIVNFKSDIHVD